jgi:hypothetical protein
LSETTVFVNASQKTPGNRRKDEKGTIGNGIRGEVNPIDVWPVWQPIAL